MISSTFVANACVMCAWTLGCVRNGLISTLHSADLNALNIRSRLIAFHAAHRAYHHVQHWDAIHGLRLQRRNASVHSNVGLIHALSLRQTPLHVGQERV